MIEMRLAYSESSIRSAFSSKRYLLESVVERVLEDVAVEKLIEALRGQRFSKRQRNSIDRIYTHSPVELKKFFGLRKYSAEWWCAVVCLRNPTMDDALLHLIGWSNNHGTQATLIGLYSVASEHHVDSCLHDAQVRVQAKLESAYDLVLECQDLRLQNDPVMSPEFVAIAADFEEKERARKHREEGAKRLKKEREERARRAVEEEEARKHKEEEARRLIEEEMEKRRVEEKEHRLFEEKVKKREVEMLQEEARQDAEDLGGRPTSSGAVSISLADLQKRRKKSSEW